MVAVKRILRNQIYIGNLAQLRTTTVSYKNHKTIRKDESDWVIVENNHEPIISKELWDKVREVDASVSTGKQTKQGITLPLSGLCYCEKYGTKAKQQGSAGRHKTPSGYACGLYAHYGKKYCTSHYITVHALEQIVLADIQRQIDFVMNDDDAREKFLIQKRGIEATRLNYDKQRYSDIEKRIAELDGLIQSVYEDKAGAEELTRQMALDLIEYITLDENPRKKSVSRNIHIYYKLIDQPLKDKTNALA